MATSAMRIGSLAAALVASALVAAPPAAATDPPARTCSAPTLVDLGIWGTVSEDLPGESLGVVWPTAVTSPTLDVDDDGLADVLDGTQSGRVDITPGDGGATLSVTGLPPSIAWSEGHADLDGDGHDDLWGTYATQGTFGHQETLVIPGKVLTGSHDGSDVALSFRGKVVGDVDGDGLDDAQVQEPNPQTLPPVPDPGAHIAGYRRFVGATATVPPSFPTGAPWYGVGDDLDQDGLHDAVTIDRGAGPGTLHLSATGTTLTYETPVAYGAVVFYRDAGRTYLVTTTAPSRVDVPHARFEVRMDCARAWVGRVGEALLGRRGDDADLGAVDPLARPTPEQRQLVATAANLTAEARAHLVDQRFQQALHRPADPVGRAWWVAALREGRRSPQSLSANLFGSGELFRSVGSDLGAWVAALYQRALGYAPDPSGAAYWKKQAASLGRERAAVRFLNAGGARRALVRAWYLSDDGLGRAATPGEVAAGEALLAAGGWDAFVVATVADDPFYLVAQVSHRLDA